MHTSNSTFHPPCTCRPHGWSFTMEGHGEGRRNTMIGSRGVSVPRLQGIIAPCWCRWGCETPNQEGRASVNGQFFSMLHCARAFILGSFLDPVFFMLSVQGKSGWKHWMRSSPRWSKLGGRDLDSRSRSILDLFESLPSSSSSSSFLRTARHSALSGEGWLTGKLWTRWTHNPIWDVQLILILIRERFGI